MKSFKDKNKHSFIAAISYSILLINQLFLIIYKGIDYLEFEILLELAIYLGFAVLLFIGDKKRELLIVTGIYILLSTRIFIGHLFLPDLLHFGAAVSIFIIILLSMKQNKIIRNIWFVPPLLLVLSLISLWIRISTLQHFHSELEFSVSFYWREILIDIIHVSGLFFMSLWLRMDSFTYKKVSNNTTIKYDSVD